MKSSILILGVLFAGMLPVSARAATGIRLRKQRRVLCPPAAHLFCPYKGAASPTHIKPDYHDFSLNSEQGGDFSLDAHVGEGIDSFGRSSSLNARGEGQAQGGRQQSGIANFSPGQSTVFGQHAVEWTLLTAPIAAFALSPALDHRLHYDNSGIWKRNRQLDFEYAVILGEVGGSLWFGGQSRIGKTFWRSMDASLYTAVTVQAMKYAFGRARPRQSASPDHWFQGNCCQSFPSGEVSFQASAVTPFIAEYHKQYPWVWALEALPAYDALARMKTHGHWQTDVLAAWAIGTAWGLYAHYEPNPLILGIMPHGIMVGIHVDF